MKRLNQAGDTIVEVLIVMAIVSLVLVISFVTSNRSLKSIQDAQEHNVAQELVTSQIEELRTLASSTTDASHNVFTYTSGFCVTDSSGTGSFNLSAASAAACKVDSGGHPTTDQPQYNIQITRPNSCGSGCLFTVQATWPSIIDGSTNNVTMYYRFYQGAS